MMFEAKKLIICLLFINYLLASSCPNMCSGHGSCGKGGVCSCFPGWIDGDCSSRTCPYGHSFVDPTQPPDVYSTLTARASLECSGQGTCDRTSGSCKCFDGYEGVSCDRLSCPSNCNGHGVCTAVKMIDLNEDSHIGSYYENDWTKIGTSPTGKYDGWDADQSYVCVCDGEYSGYDCSEKKCPTGYVENSDCDSPSKSTQTIDTKYKKGTGAGAAADNFDYYPCMAYAEYTDQYNRKWYTDAFCVACDATGADATTDPLCANVKGWKEALLSLPVGVIDLDKTTPVSVTKSGSDFDTVTINFGDQQTGKQNPIKIITSAELGDKTNDLIGTVTAPLQPEMCGSCGSGYHGMTNDQLYLDADGKLSTERKKADIKVANYHTPLPYTAPIVATVDGIPPLECSRNGLCDRSSGLCKCFDGYYGIACTEQASML